jgi:hypothetical protein
LANGVRKDALAPIATLITIGSAETFMSFAAANAIGIITRAVEVLEMNCVIRVAARKTPTSESMTSSWALDR